MDKIVAANMLPQALDPVANKLAQALDPVDITYIKYNLEYDRSDISKPLLEDKNSLDRFLLVKNEPMLIVYSSRQGNVDQDKVRAVICCLLESANKGC